MNGSLSFFLCRACIESVLVSLPESTYVIKQYSPLLFQPATFHISLKVDSDTEMAFFTDAVMIQDCTG